MESNYLATKRGLSNLLVLNQICAQFSDMDNFSYSIMIRVGIDLVIFMRLWRDCSEAALRNLLKNNVGRMSKKRLPKGWSKGGYWATATHREKSKLQKKFFDKKI